MTELQSGLVLAGVAAVVGVYAFNWWQARRRRRDIEDAVAAHATNRGAIDPLEIPTVRRPGLEVQDDVRDEPVFNPEPAEPVEAHDRVPDDVPDEPVGESAGDTEVSGPLALRRALQAARGESVEAGDLAAAGGFDGGAGFAGDDPPAAREPFAAAGGPTVSGSGLQLRADPAEIDRRLDHVIRLLPVEPITAETVSGWLARTPDLGKPLQVLGCPVGEQDWHPVLQQSVRYEELAFCLQMVDRRGLVERSALDRFCDWVGEIAEESGATPSEPDRGESLALASKLDRFCADADVLIGVNVVAADVPVPATKVRALAEAAGFRLQSDGNYALTDESGGLLLTLGDIEGKPFANERIRAAAVTGVTLLLDIPRTQRPSRVFNQLLAIARQIAQGIGGRLVDDQRQVLTEGGIKAIGNRIGTIEASLSAERLAPGSALARRVFA